MIVVLHGISILDVYLISSIASSFTDTCRNPMHDMTHSCNRLSSYRKVKAGYLLNLFASFLHSLKVWRFLQICLPHDYGCYSHNHGHESVDGGR